MKSGEPWILENDTLTQHICCDCGLVHEVYVKIKKGKAILKYYRNDFDTDKLRKKEGTVIYRRKNKNGKKNR